MHYFEYKKNKLFCEDVGVDALARKYGTPLYVYSQRTIIEHFEKIKSAFSEIDPLICYSVKANSNLSILRMLVQRGSGLDIVSGGELFRARKVKCPMSKIVYASVGKTEEEITDAMKAGILLFNAESLAELERINQIAQTLNMIQDVALRINPDVEAQTHRYITTGRKDTKFGLDLKTAAMAFLTGARKYKNLRLSGIHIHIGSQIIKSAPFIKAITRILVLVDDLRRRGMDLRYFDIGGGLGIIYDDEKPQTADEFAKKIGPLLKNKNLKIILEPGRFIVGNAGILVSKVLYLKTSYQKQFVIVDAGMNDLIRPSLYGAYHRIVSVRRKARDARHKIQRLADIVGPICESGDFLGKDRNLQIKSDEYVAVLGAGAYSFSMSSNYNSRLRPAEIMIDGSAVKLIRERENYEDLISHEK